MLLIAAGEEVRFSVADEGFQYLLYFPSARHGVRLEVPQYIDSATNHIIGEWILRLWELLSRPQGTGGNAIMTGALTQMILAECHRLTQENGSESVGAVRRLGRELATYPESGGSAEALARRAGLSRNYLARQFRELFGASIPEFQRLKRIDRAMLYLESTDMRITEIGTRVGYPDPAHFNKRFRETAGCSPSHYRENGGSTDIWPPTPPDTEFPPAPQSPARSEAPTSS